MRHTEIGIETPNGIKSVLEYREETRFGLSTIYAKIRRGEIRTVSLGKTRIGRLLVALAKEYEVAERNGYGHEEVANRIREVLK